MARIYHVAFSLLYIMIVKESSGYIDGVVVDEHQSVWYDQQNLKRMEMDIIQNVSSKKDIKQENSSQHSKEKRSIHKKPLLPEPNVATSSECISCYKRRRGCFVVRLSYFS